MSNAWIDGFNMGSTTNQAYFHDIRDSVIESPVASGLSTNYKSGRLYNTLILSYFANYTGNTSLVNKYNIYNSLTGMAYTKPAQFRTDDHIRLVNFAICPSNGGSATGVFTTVATNTTYTKRIGFNRAPQIRNSVHEGWYGGYPYNALNANQTFGSLAQFKLFENNFVNTKYMDYTTGRGFLGHSQPIMNHILKNYKPLDRWTKPYPAQITDAEDGLLKRNTGVWEAETVNGFILHEDVKFNNKPSMVQSSISYGGGAPYFTIKEPTMFKLYTNTRLVSGVVQYKEASHWKKCIFYANKDCDITLSFSMDYRNTPVQLLQNSVQYGSNASYKIIPEQVYANKFDSRHFFLTFTESDQAGYNGKVLDVERLDSDSQEFTTHSYHKTFSVKQGSFYSFYLKQSQYYLTYNGLVHAMDYKIPSFNIFTDDLSDIDVTLSSFDSEKGFDSYDNDLRNQSPGSRNQGVIPTKRQAGSQTGVVKLNKIKL